jgi:aspartate kinase
VADDRRGPIVHKFGGTCVADADGLRTLAELVLADERPAVVVVSALAGTTATLAEISRSETGEARTSLGELWDRHMCVLGALESSSPDAVGSQTLSADAQQARTRMEQVRDVLLSQIERPPTAQRHDRLLAGGEDLSVHLAAHVLRSVGLDARVVDARELVRTDEHFGAAVPQQDILADRVRGHLEPLLSAGTTVVVQGFVGSDARGRTTTLGRGGSDHTAVLLGAALEAREVVIWTDVAGMYTSDPEAVEGVRVIPELGFEEAVELAYFGAKVLQPSAAKHAVAERVPLRIRDARNPTAEGTVIRHDRRGAAAFAAVAYKPDVILIEVRAFPVTLEHGFLARVFGVLARHEVAVDLVATSHSSTAFTVDRAEEIFAVRQELSEFADVDVSEGLATVTVVGRGLMSRPGMDAQAFWALGDTSVYLISQASDVSLSFVVDDAEARGLIQRLHGALIDAEAASEKVGS